MAGSNFAEITLEDMETFLKRAFHALRPRKNQGRGEITFDLSLSDNHSILVRIYTSIYAGSGRSRDKGSDSIKVVLLTDKGKPLAKKVPIVKRTTNWRTALQDRIETYLEDYEAKVDYWKSLRLERHGEMPKPSDPLDQAVIESLPPPTPAEVREMEEEDAEAREVQEEAERERRLEEENSREEPPAPAAPKESFEGEYRKLPEGGFGVVIYTKGHPGEEGVGKTKGGQRSKIRLLQKKKDFKDPYRGNAPAEFWTFEDVNPRQRGYQRRWAEDESVDVPADAVVASVVERYMSRMV